MSASTRRSQRLLRPLAIMLVGAAVSVGLSGGPARASAPSSQTPRLMSVTRVDMVVAGFDAATAKAHGYTITTNAKGQQISVPTAAAATSSATGSATPDNVVSGNCGSSYVFLYDIGSKKYRVATGFGVFHSAVGYLWRANVIGPRYNYTHRWSGGLLLRRTWSGSAVGLVNVAGFHTVKASGYTALSNGAICYSLGPIDTEAIY